MTDKEINVNDVLSFPMKENSADAKTIGEYLYKLLYNVYNMGESFSGKRPFGDGGWEHELYSALEDGGFILDNYVEGAYVLNNEQVAHAIIFKCIKHVFQAYLED